MIGKGKSSHAATAVALTAVAALAAGCSSASAGSSGVGSIASSLPTNYGPAEQTTLNVGVVRRWTRPGSSSHSTRACSPKRA